jgi:hypothetical protein
MVHKELSCLVFASLLPLVALAEPVRAQVKPRVIHRKPPAGSMAVHECGNGVTLELTKAYAAQGGLLELTLRSDAPLSDLKGDWAGTALPLWDGTGNVHHALLGIDLQRPPGEYEAQISARLANGQDLTCSSAVDVRTGRFVVERLKVAPGFVELSPENEARAATESKRVHEILATITPERLWSGRFRFPLAGKPRGHNFGTRRILNGDPRSPHSGLDISAPAGTPIHAAQSGRVVLADNLFFSGNTVILDHGLGVYTFYGHMKVIKVKEGEDVRTGDILGLVGATGRATGPHLHWSLIVDGAYVNPLGIIRLPLR